VFLLTVDPVAEGLISSIARPGANVTGFDQSDFALGGKWVQLLKEIMPGIAHVAVMGDDSGGGRAGYLRSIEEAARSLNVSVTPMEVHDYTEIERRIVGLQQTNLGLIFPPSSLVASHRAQIIELVARHRLPAIYFARFFASDGGLISYGIDQPHLFRQAGGYVDRILRGARPADLPSQSPTKFELVVNLKTAKALGLTMPPTLLALADEVIE
jgi:putative ABC transport system substrate-binding protein